MLLFVPVLYFDYFTLPPVTVVMVNCKIGYIQTNTAVQWKVKEGF